jgi:formylglycine-generating enzyme required for sulfatase activity
MYSNGATITSERITTSSLPQRIQRARRPALSVFFGVGRGGSARYARSANRHGNDADNHYDNNGFRLVRELD